MRYVAMHAYTGWTEDELSREIERLDTLIAKVVRSEDKRARCVASYLRQVRKDRSDSLAVLRLRTRH